MLAEREIRCKEGHRALLLNSPSEVRTLLYICYQCSRQDTISIPIIPGSEPRRIVRTCQLAKGIDIDSLWHDKEFQEVPVNGTMRRNYQLLNAGKLAAEIDPYGRITIFNWFQGQVETAFAGYLNPLQTQEPAQLAP